MSLYLYGTHACRSALSNPKRIIEHIWITKKTNEIFKINKKVEVVDPKVIDKLLPQGSLHQGIAMKVQPLPPLTLDDITWKDSSCVVILDQVTDPHNIGAVQRSCAVFGAQALILPKHHAPKESGIMAKIASGALDIVPLIYVNNLSQAINELQNQQFWIIGLSEKGKKPLHEFDLKGRVGLVLGSEGDGMRRLTSELCDFHAFLPFAHDFSTLNVSNATAISLYEVFKSNTLT